MKKRFQFQSCTGCGEEKPHGQIFDFYQNVASCAFYSIVSGMNILKVMLLHSEVKKRRQSQIKKQIMFELRAYLPENQQV